MMQSKLLVLLFQLVQIEAWTLSSSPIEIVHARTSASIDLPEFSSRPPWSVIRRRTQNSFTETFLTAAASDITMMNVPYAEIVGAGRIGALLAEAGQCAVLGRNDKIDQNGTGPIFIATRNDELEGIISKCPDGRRADLVFMQNGYLEEFLASKDLADNTQALLYLAVPKKGETPMDGDTAINPEGLTAATGKHAQALADRLAALNLKCKVLSMKEYRPAMFEKLIWISAYMLVGVANDCDNVGQAGEERKQQVKDIVAELVSATSQKERIAFPDGVYERLQAYTDKVSHFPCGVKEFEWRNQYFYNLGHDVVPQHNALLTECAKAGKLGFTLP